MQLAKKSKKLATGFRLVERVTKYHYKSTGNVKYFKYVEVFEGRDNVSCESRSITEKEAEKLVKKLKGE